MKVCIDNDLNPEIASDIYEDTDEKVIEKNNSKYQINTNMIAGGYMSIKVKYSIKENAYKNLNNKKIVIRMPKNTELHTTGIKLDSKLITNYNISNYNLEIPVEKQSGEITFCLLPKDSSKIKTYVGLKYTRDSKECFEIFDAILENFSPITIVAPEATYTGKVDIKGIAPKGANVTICVDGMTDVETTASSTTGKYNAEINVSKAINHKKYKIIAKAKDSNENEISAYTYVQYSTETPEINSFIMNYSDHKKNQIDLLNYKNNSKTLYYYPQVAPSFELSFSNAQKIDKVYVVSTKNGEKKYLEAKYDASKNKYVASGYFDEKNKDRYVPGVISYEYSVKRDNVEVSYNYDLENTAFAEIGKEMKDKVTVETVKNTVSEKEYKYKLDKEAANLGVKELNIIMKTMDKDFSEAFAVTKDYSKLMKYTTKDGAGNEFELNVDFSDPKEVKTLVHDITSSKAIEYIVKTNVDDPYKAEEFLSTYSHFTTTASLFSDYMEIGYDTQQLKDEIISRNMNYEDTNEALRKAEGLGNDRRKFLIMTTVMSLTLATVGTGGMAAPALVFSLMLSGMSAYGDFMFEYRANQIKGQEISLNWLIDPSGYVYEAVPSNKLEDVKCTIYYKDSKDGKAKLWNANQYEQENPLYTDKEGKYAWDVPEGLWQVKYEKNGYETKYSDWLPVPPPQTEVNIGLVSKQAPKVLYVNYYDTYIDIKFDKYMYVDTLNASSIIIKDSKNNNVSYNIEYVNAQTNDSGVKLADEVKLKTKLDKNQSYNVTINTKARNYANVSINEQKFKKIVSNLPTISVESENIDLKQGNSKVIEAVIQNVENGILRCASTNDIAISVPEKVEIKNGKASITVNAKFKGSALIILEVDGTGIYKKVYVNCENGNESILDIPSKDITLVEKQQLKLAPIIYPSTEKQEFIYTSSNKEVAKVDSNGNVTALNTGKAVITIKSKDGKKQVEVNVEVYKEQKYVEPKNENTGNTGNTAKNNTPKVSAKSIVKAKVSGITNKTYTGKALKQNVTVKDGNKVLKNGTDYTVTYKNNKNVGTATAIITGKGNYTGKINKTFKINPKGTKLKKLTKGSKKFKATWKAQKTQTTGYEVQYSTNGKFKSGNKTVNIKKNKTTSTTVKKLKAKKKYYVRIRTYKIVGGKKYYSGWSKALNVKIK